MFTAATAEGMSELFFTSGSSALWSDDSDASTLASTLSGAAAVERRSALLGDELEPSGGEALRERPPHAGRTSGEGRVDETYRRLVEEQRQTVHHSQGIDRCMS